MATSRLTIATAALAEIGDEPLEFATPQDAARFTTEGVFDPEDDLQARVAAVYPQVRATLLAGYPWSWLTSRQALAAAPATNGEDAGAWPYRYRFHVPTPAIGNIRAVYDSRDASIEEVPRVDTWTVQGAHIFTGFSPAWVEAQREAAEETWPQLFVNAVTTALAARLALSLQGDLPTTRYFNQLAADDLALAKSVDSQSHPPAAVPRFDWVDERVGGGGGDYARRGVNV